MTKTDIPTQKTKTERNSEELEITKVAKETVRQLQSTSMEIEDHLREQGTTLGSKECRKRKFKIKK